MKKTVLRLLFIGTFALLYLSTFSQNVGIGTSTPNYDLQIHNSSIQSDLQFTSGGTGATSVDGFIVGQNTPAGEALIWNFENKDIEFGTNGAERMRIKADGKIGIGIGSPNYNLQIHDSSIPVLQFTSGSTGTASGDGFLVGQNTPAGEALIWNFENQDIEFGTNGAQRMRIKADGKIGMGISTPNYNLQIHDSSIPVLQFTSGSTGTTSGDGFLVGQNTPAGEALIWNFENQDIEFGTNGAQRMRIKADGKIGIGTPSPSATLHIESATNTSALSTTSLAAGGYFLASYYNETAPASIRGKYLGTGSNDGTGVFGSSNGASGGYGIGGVFIGNWYGLVGAGTTGGGAGIYADAGGATNAIYINGNIAGTGTNNYASDLRLKKNILPLTNALGAIEKMNPAVYEFKVGDFGSMSLPEGKHFGLIAQDLQKIYPELVVENNFTGDSKEGFEYLGINYTELIPVLIKGMQEQQQIIEQLQKRIETLEKK